MSSIKTLADKVIPFTGDEAALADVGAGWMLCDPMLRRMSRAMR